MESSSSGAREDALGNATRSALSLGSDRDVSRFQVALLIETSNSYSRDLLRGIRSFTREGAEWLIHFTELGRGNVPPAWFKNWHGDGVIARIENTAIEEEVAASGVPVVNVSAQDAGPTWPRVINDSLGVARLAADHLLERGFRHIAYCGDARFAWSFHHEQNFKSLLARNGIECLVYDALPEDSLDRDFEQEKISHWLGELPKPAGIFACYDIRGQQVLEACRRARLQVPDEVAVIGQHNDELLCELCDPPLSSVIPNPRRAGYEAAVLLDKMMRGIAIPAEVRTVQPIGVATRQSTDVIAIDDKTLADAVRFIRTNACRGISVEDVLQAAPISRTLLERRFQRYLGRSPYEEILRLRIERVKELLATTDLSMADIASKVGFSGVEYLSAVFKKKQGVSPRLYRRRASVK
jgi:LacI family transcriptional regulator, galactose operon repressor